MRICILALLLIPTEAGAQTQSSAAPASSLAPRPSTLTPLEPVDTSPKSNAPPLAAADGSRIISKNEAYNLGRATEGRLGVRLGNDMSYRVTGN